MATYYAVAAGSWHTATPWSLSSGGAGGAGIPTSADDVVFNPASGSVTVSITAASACRNFTVESGTTASVAHSSNITLSIHGSLSWATGWTNYAPASSTPVFRFAGTGTHTINSGDELLATVTIDCGAGTYSLAAPLNWNPGVQFTLTSGTFNQAGHAMTGGSMTISAVTTRTINLNALVTLAASGTAWNATTITNLTRNFTGSTLTFTSAAAHTFVGGGLTYDVVEFVGLGDATISGTGVFAHLKRTLNTAGVNGELILAGNQTTTNFTAAGFSREFRITVRSDSTGTARTLTVTNAPTVTDVSFRDIAAAGAGWTSGVYTRVGDALGNSGAGLIAAFQASRTLYARYAALATTSGMTWNEQRSWSEQSDAFTNAAATQDGPPLPQDDVVYTWASNPYNNSIALNMANVGRNLTVNYPLSVSLSVFLYGSLTVNAENPFSTTGGVRTITLMGRGSHTITSNGYAHGGNSNFGGYVIDAPGATYSLADNLTMVGASTSAAIILTRGTLAPNGKNITCVSFTSSGSTTRNLNFAAGPTVWTVTGTGNVWIVNNSGAFGVTASDTNLTLVSSNVSSTDRQFSIDNRNIARVRYAVDTPAVLTISGPAGNTQTIGTMEVSGTGGTDHTGKRVRFAATTGTTPVFNVNAWEVTATEAAPLLIQGSLLAAGSATARITSPSGTSLNNVWASRINATNPMTVTGSLGDNVNVTVTTADPYVKSSHYQVNNNSFANNTAYPSTFTAAKPADLAVGDEVLLIPTWSRLSTIMNITAITVPAGFVLEASADRTGYLQHVYRKRITDPAGEPANWTVGFTNSSGGTAHGHYHVHVVTNTPGLDVESAWTSTGSSTSHTVPGMTTTSRAFVLTTAVSDNVNWPLASWPDLAYQVGYGGGGNASSSAVLFGIQPAAGSTGNETYTFAQSASMSSIALAFTSTGGGPDPTPSSLFIGWGIPL